MLPRARRAANVASVESTPRASISRCFIAPWNAISSARSTSNCRFRIAYHTRRRSCRMAPLCGEDLMNREDDLIEFPTLDGELLPPCRGQRVVACTPVVLRRAPLCLDPASYEQP